MKLSELSIVKEETKGKWKIGNLKGVYKNFKKNDSPDALAWMRDRSTEDHNMKWDESWGKWVRGANIVDRETAKRIKDDEKRVRERERAEAKKNQGPTAKELEQLYLDGMDAIGSSFPDGDPIDHMLDTLNRNNWTTHEIDLAFKKYGHGHEKKGFYAAVEGMWDDMQPDQMHDANIDLKAGRTPNRSAFYDIVDGKVVASRNPWK